MSRGFTLPALAAAAALVGILTGWIARDQQCQRERMALVLERSLVRASIAVDSLAKLPEGKDDGARRVLEVEMTFAMADASDMVRRGATLERPSPYLRPALERIRAYALSHRMSALAEQARRVLDALNSSP